MLSRLCLAGLIAAFLLPYTAQSQNKMKTVMDAVSADSMIQSLKELTGAVPVSIGGRQRTINSRMVLTTGNRWASQFIEEKFRSFGLASAQHAFSFTMPWPHVQMNYTGLSVSKTMLYLSNDWGEVFCSADSGATWNSIRRSGIRINDRADWICVQDPSRIFVLGSTGVQASTTTSGESWNAKASGLTKLAHVASMGETILAADSSGCIWRSTDLGQTWMLRHTDTTMQLHQVVFHGRTGVLVVATDKLSKTGRIVRSDDAGATWSSRPLPGSSAALTSGCAADSLCMWIAGAGGMIFRTVTGGSTWTSAHFADTSVAAREVFFYDTLHGWITGANNAVYRTLDGGATWQRVYDFGPSVSVEDLRFSNPSRGMILGKLNTLFHTTDGGVSWRQASLPLLTNVIATIPGTRYPERYILFTAHSDCDAGILPGTANDRFVNAPGADDDGTGVVGLFELARIFSKYRLPVSVKFATLPDEEGMNAGAKAFGAMLLAGKDSLLTAIDFDMIGYDSLYPQRVGLLYNTNGYDGRAMAERIGRVPVAQGVTLTVNLSSGTVPNLRGFTGMPYPLLAFADTPGLGLYINPNYHKTKDTWSTINPNYLRDIVRTVAGFTYDIAMNLFTNEGELDPDPDPDPDPVPAEYALAQNFPNPFNPVTSIRFAIPRDGRVSLKIYDVLGRELITLVDGHRSAGGYQVQWNASRYPSGIYYYRVTAGEFTSVRKMTLQK